MSEGTPDPIARLEQANEVFLGVLRNVRPEQLHMNTPDPEWDVTALIGHVVYGNRWAVDFLRTGSGSWPAGGDALGGRPPEEVYTESMAAALAAFREPGALDRPITLPFGETTAAFLTQILFGQLLEHAWDLAKATGQDTNLAPDLYQAALPGPGEMDEQARGDFYAPAQPAPPGASAADRYAAFFGRSL